MERAHIKSMLLLTGAFIAYKLSILLAWNGDALSSGPWATLQPDCFVALFVTWGLTSAVALFAFFLHIRAHELCWTDLKRMLSLSFGAGMASVLAFLMILSSSSSMPALLACAIVMSAAYVCMHIVCIVFALKTNTLALLAMLIIGQLATSLSFMIVKQMSEGVQAGCLVATCAVLFVTTFALIMQDESDEPPAALFPRTGSNPLFNPLVAGIAISTLGVGILWGSSPSVQDYKLWVFGAIAVCMVFLVVSLVRKRAVNPELLVQIVFATLGVAILLASVAPGWHTAFMGIVWIGYSVLSICLFLLGKKGDGVPVDGRLLVAALAIFDSNIALGLGLGRLISTVAPSIETPTTVAVALLLAFIFLFGNRHRIRSREKPERVSTTLVDTEDIDEAMRERCAAFGGEHGLTEAEVDTLFYLAKGHSIDRIAQDRFVSRNTIKSQLTSMYRKIGIHSKQELLRLLEAAGEQALTPPA